MSEHARLRIDELIHQPVRFSIIAALAAARELEFAFVRDTVDVSDSLLSRYVSQLEGAGYVSVRKGYVGKRPRTWLALSARGRDAFAAHLDVLREIVGASLEQSEKIAAPTLPGEGGDRRGRDRVASGT
jgi:DNA-binding MarR family transcriptional regulator